MSRVTFTGCLDQIAECEACDWQYSNPKNGLALAAQHHDKTGHVVCIAIYNHVRYGYREGEEGTE